MIHCYCNPGITLGVEHYRAEFKDWLCRDCYQARIRALKDVPNG